MEAEKTEYERCRAQSKLNHQLLRACKDGNVVEAKTYIELGASLNYYYSEFRQLITPSPLLAALRRKNLEIMRLMLEKGANPNEFTEGNSLLAFAVQERFIDAIHLLISFGVNVYARSSNSTIAHFLVEKEDQEILDIVRPNGVEAEILPNYVANQNIPKIQFLIKNRVDLNHLDFYGRSVLDSVCRRQSFGILKILLAAGINANKRRSEDIMTPLHILSSYNDFTPTRVLMASELIRYGADVNAMWTMRLQGGGFENNTPLHAAIVAGFPKMIKFLIMSGATPTDNEKVDKDGTKTITKCTDLNETDKNIILAALQPFWTPSTFYLFPTEIQKTIIFLFWVHREQKWPFDKSIMNKICNYIVYNFYNEKKMERRRKSKRKRS